jgi:holo-[acyl-carrier protein] synthase
VIVGIGVDVVDLERFAVMLDRTPHLADRVFTTEERQRKPESLAAVFAAKEAVAKALGAPSGLDWQEVEVHHDADGRPRLSLVGESAVIAHARGATRWHLSLSHDAGTAVAMVVVEDGS